MSPVRRHPQLAFLALALLVDAAATAAARAVTDPALHRTVAAAAVCDMTLSVTALYYWLVVRPGFRPPQSLFLILFLGALRASFAFPDVVPGRAWLGAGAELCLAGILLAGFRRWRAGGPSDPVSRIEAILSGLIPFETARRALAGELSVFWYAFAWRAKPDVPAGSAPFTLHRRSGFADLILLVGLASLLEVVPVHLIVGHLIVGYRSVPVAWILTGLSLYGALWAFALWRSFALRPGLIALDGEVLVRFGLFFQLRIPAGSILSVGREPVPGALVVPRNAAATVYIRFRTPLVARKLFGFTKTVSAIGLSPDEPTELEEALPARTP